jgi:starch synthase (maltosyl-transferring)
LFPKLTGTFSKWYSHLERAKILNFNWIFINPIQLPGFSGSMYSIKDYYEIDPRYLDGDEFPEEQLENVIQQAHKLNLNIMIDLVINHTAIDSVLVKQHPEWYKYDKKGKIRNPRAMAGKKVVAVWGDLAEIDNDNSLDKEKLWQYWEDLVMHFIDLGFDGFRCDAAYQVPVALWERLIHFAKNKNNNIKFFAESLGCPFKDVITLGQAGFDFTFNSSKYWDFEAAWALEQYDENRKKASPTVSFAESHDTNRLAFELKKNWAAIKMRYLFSALFSSGVMMPIGFEFGFQKSLHVVKTTFLDWEKISYDLQDFIRRVNEIKLNYLVFAQESRIKVIETTNPKIFCFQKFSKNGKETGLVIINKDMKNSQILDLSNNTQIKELTDKLKEISVDNKLNNPLKSAVELLYPAEVVIFWGKSD